MRKNESPLTVPDKKERDQAKVHEILVRDTKTRIMHLLEMMKHATSERELTNLHLQVRDEENSLRIIQSK